MEILLISVFVIALGIVIIAWSHDSKMWTRKFDEMRKDHNRLVQNHNILNTKVERMREAIGEMMSEIDKKLKP